MSLTLRIPRIARTRTRPRRASATTIDERRARAAALLGLGTVTSVAFGAVAHASARRTTEPTDHQLHGAMRQRLDDSAAGDAAVAAAPVVDPAGKWWVYGPAALAVAAAVLAAPGVTPRTRRGRRIGALAIASVPAIATPLGQLFDRALPQPPVGPRRRPVDHPVFPSGHAFRLAAVTLAACYVVVREELAHPAAAWPVAVAAPAIVGIARLVREKHLASDVVGGWLAGIALAALTASAYELARTPRRHRHALRD